MKFKVGDRVVFDTISIDDDRDFVDNLNRHGIITDIDVNEPGYLVLFDGDSAAVFLYVDEIVLEEIYDSDLYRALK